MSGRPLRLRTARRLLTTAALCVLAVTRADAQREVENVAAFARLYGVARWFYPSDAAASLDWNRFALEGVRRVRDARTAAALATTLRELFTPLGPGLEIGASLPARRPAGSRDPSLVAWYYRGAGFSENPGPYSATRTNRVNASGSPAPPAGHMPSAQPVDSLDVPLTGAAIDFKLSPGTKARVPTSLTDADARTESSALAGLRGILASLGASDRDDVNVRLADVVVAWSVFRHFYPYWSDLSVDWDARLRPQLQNALDAATTREAHRDVLRLVVADLHDGHGSVRDVAATPLGLLPVQFRVLNARLVITASNAVAAPVGSVITAMDGVSAAARVAEESRLASGTLQWRHARAASALLTCRLQSTVAVTIELPDGSVRDAQLPCVDRSVPRAVEVRPDSIVELETGLWYVDLTRVRAAQLRATLDTLATARGVVFDMRGYPTDAGYAVLPHLLRAPEDSTDRWMHVPRIARPFGAIAAWQSFSWNLRPAAPHIGGQRVFLIDGRAISYAESVMGYVRDYMLGTVIGSATAGANGNVATFSVPGGFSIAFTGMRVTRHDGATRFHMEGVAPDVPLEPTVAGIRARRDELLERALVILRTR